MKYLALLFILLVPTAQAQLYKWVDENGQTHYSERRPSNADVTTIKEQKHNVSKPYTPSRRDTQKSILEQAQAKKDEKKQAAEDAKQKAEVDTYCAEQKQRLSTLSSGRRLRVKDDSGNYSYLDEAQRNKEIAEMQKGIKEHCK